MLGHRGSAVTITRQIQGPQAVYEDRKFATNPKADPKALQFAHKIDLPC